MTLTMLTQCWSRHSVSIVDDLDYVDTMLKQSLLTIGHKNDDGHQRWMLMASHWLIFFFFLTKGFPKNTKFELCSRILYLCEYENVRETVHMGTRRRLMSDIPLKNIYIYIFINVPIHLYLVNLTTEAGNNSVKSYIHKLICTLLTALISTLEIDLFIFCNFVHPISSMLGHQVEICTQF